MKRSGPPKRTQQQLKRSTELKRTRMKPTAKARATKQAGIDRMAELRPQVFARAGETCEVRSEGCTGSWQLSAHHRWPRGPEAADCMENLVAACQSCHTDSPAAIHRNVAWAEACGLSIRRSAGPPTEVWCPSDSARNPLPPVGGCGILDLPPEARETP